MGHGDGVGHCGWEVCEKRLSLNGWEKVMRAGKMMVEKTVRVPVIRYRCSKELESQRVWQAKERDRHRKPKTAGGELYLSMAYCSLTVWEREHCHMRRSTGMSMGMGMGFSCK